MGLFWSKWKLVALPKWSKCRILAVTLKWSRRCSSLECSPLTSVILSLKSIRGSQRGERGGARTPFVIFARYDCMRRPIHFFSYKWVHLSTRIFNTTQNDKSEIKLKPTLNIVCPSSVRISSAHVRHWKRKRRRKIKAHDSRIHPVSYTHLTLPTIYSV